MHKAQTLWKFRIAGFLCAMEIASGCSSDTSSMTLPIDYYQGELSAALGVQGNQATCATCHSNDGSPRTGSTFTDIAFRSSFNAGASKTLLEAINVCVSEWMGGRELKSADSEFLQLKSYLESLSDPSKKTPNLIQPEVLANTAAYEAAYQGGNAILGMAKYRVACAGCHSGGLHVGQAQAPQALSIRTYSIGRISQKVRTSGSPLSGTSEPVDSTPGPMPFFELGDLPSADLKDIVAYVRGSP